MGEFSIPLYVREESSLYNEYDPSGTSFSSDLTDYLGDYIADRKLGEKVCIEIKSEKAIDASRFQNAFRKYIDKLSARNRKEIRLKKANAIRLLMIGILFVLLGIASASHINDVLTAIISTVASFSVWEASAVWIEVLPDLRKTDRILRVLADTDIRYMESEHEKT